MKVETKILDNQQAEIVAEFEPQELETAKRRSAKQLAKRVRIPGFRPGKAPYDMIERTVGEEAIVDAAVEILVNDHYAQMLTDAELTPYASGSLEEVVSLDPPTFRFSVPLNPEVVLGDYQEIRQDYEAPVVMDAEVEEVLLDLQNRQAVFEAVERSIEAGDQVVLTLSGQRSEAKEDQPTQIVPERQQTIDVLADGADSSDEWPFPGFSAQLIGLAAGDEKTLLTVYPEDYAFEDLRDVEAEFKLTVQEVKSRTLPEMNDEFAQFFGEEFPTIEALRDRIRQNMEAEATRKYESEYTETLLQKILEVSNVKFPALMLEREVDGLYNEMKSNIESRGMDMETYLKMRSMDEAAFREELRPPAEERLVRNLLLLEIAGKDDIQVPRQVIEQQTYQQLGQITQNMSEKEVRKLVSKDFMNMLVSSVTNDVYMLAVLDHLRTIAKGEAEAVEAGDQEMPVETSDLEKLEKAAEQAVEQPEAVEVVNAGVADEVNEANEITETDAEPVAEEAQDDAEPQA